MQGVGAAATSKAGKGKERTDDGDDDTVLAKNQDWFRVVFERPHFAALPFYGLPLLLSMDCGGVNEKVVDVGCNNVGRSLMKEPRRICAGRVAHLLFFYLRFHQLNQKVFETRKGVPRPVAGEREDEARAIEGHILIAGSLPPSVPLPSLNPPQAVTRPTELTAAMRAHFISGVGSGGG